MFLRVNFHRPYINIGFIHSLAIYVKNNYLLDFIPMGKITRAEEERAKGSADTIEAVNKAQYPSLNFKNNFIWAPKAVS